MGQNNFTWICPVGVTRVIAECWGAGAGGYTGWGAGGGGGAYSRRSLAVTPGNPYNVAQGLSGGPFQNGDRSTFTADLALICDALGGSTGFTGPNPGGQASGGTGDVKFSGGSGFVPGAGALNGGGGGGSADDTGDGADGLGPSGGAPRARGGGGGAGASNTVTNSSPGTGPGGGGGGAVGGTSATGADGGVVLWNDTGAIGWPAVTANPPLASFGSTPPPPPPPFNPKARKSVSII